MPYLLGFFVVSGRCVVLLPLIGHIFSPSTAERKSAVRRQPSSRPAVRQHLAADHGERVRHCGRFRRRSPVTHGQLKITHDYSRFPTFRLRPTCGHLRKLTISPLAGDSLSKTIRNYPKRAFRVSTFQTFPKLSKIAFSPCAASKRVRRSRSLPKTPVFIGCAAFRPVQNFSKPALPFFLFRLTSASPRDTLPSTFPLAAMALPFASLAEKF